MVQTCGSMPLCACAYMQKVCCACACSCDAQYQRSKLHAYTTLLLTFIWRKKTRAIMKKKPTQRLSKVMCKARWFWSKKKQHYTLPCENQKTNKECHIICVVHITNWINCFFFALLRHPSDRAENVWNVSLCRVTRPRERYTNAQSNASKTLCFDRKPHRPICSPRK